MQTTGEQNYWQGAQDDTAGDTPTATSQYVGEELRPDSDVQAQEPAPTPAVTWQASEYIQHDKDALWFIGLVAITTILVLVAIYLLHSWTFVALILVMAFATIVYARRPPRLLSYTIDHNGLTVDDRLYPHHEFRSFAVVKDGPLYFIMLLPVKRFMPAVTVYFPAENGEAIVDALGSVLPIEQRELDFVDRLVRKLRF